MTPTYVAAAHDNTQQHQREAQNAPSVATSGVVVTYGQELQLTLPDICVYPQELLLLTGPSGSGKTTLLHVLAGLLRPTQGTVSVAGCDMTALPERALAPFRAQHIGVVFQDFHLIASYNALDNIVVAGAAAGIPLPTAKKTAQQLLQQLGMGRRCHHKPRQLSTGERQRVAIARAVATQPQLLLADEPTANLDRARARKALALLERVASAAGAALIVSTHDPLVKEHFPNHCMLNTGATTTMSTPT